MKNFRIYYKTVGVTTKTTPFANITARNAEEASEKFYAQYGNHRDIVAIFKA